ncbi:MAG: CBS domain-containing protein, partial [Alphaproteobacteria bacterium]|nr:CBS domain-containing protein [Alphaproteobacteria bacterium]
VIKKRGGSKAHDLAAIAAPPWFVPETMSLEEQLAAFRRKRTHFALVVDEYGGLQGLVTLEDILDEIFGDIPDEHEARTAPGIVPQPDGSFILEGTLPVRDLNRELDWHLPDEVATTIAGLVIHAARTIPDIGQRFAFFGFEFEILRKHRNQVLALRVTPRASALNAPATLPQE